jgi:hypothetical protein
VRPGLTGVTVRRFLTSQTRDIDDFNRYSDWIFQNPHDAAAEMEWLRRQGPWSPGLIEYITRHHKQYDALIFFTYLYAPTVLGLRIDPARSILIPTAHDEPPIHLGIFKDVFRRRRRLDISPNRSGTSSRGPSTEAPPSRRPSGVASRSPRITPIRARRLSADPRPTRVRLLRPPNSKTLPTRRMARLAGFRHTRRLGVPPSDADTGFTAPSLFTAAGSIRARAGRSCSST